ncbi:hypothetical protein ANRL1_02272 [Anaerolineae bacterium]|nr:hypothetical protein ANRL1_02272 [Anaerolineae bacterium]
MGALAAYVYIWRPRHLRWGATDEEIVRVLPGDELVPNPKLNATHALTIHAPASAVWQWLVQIGQGRGGFYSYDFIENAMGLDIHNAERILPEFQNLNVGDNIPLSPDGFGIPVAILEPHRALVLRGDTRLDPSAIPTMKPGDYFAVTWGWYLDAIDANTTRLVERWRADWNPSWQQNLFMRAFLEPGAFLMERKMLLGIKERAEAKYESSI